MTSTSTSWVKPSSTSCHNCRRRRLRCDRSHPVCHKCTNRGEKCLGYGKLFRWTNAVASRGRFAGQTFDHGVDLDAIQGIQASPTVSTSNESPRSLRHTGSTLTQHALVDPLFQDLGLQTRCYIDHFAKTICKDLVSFDQQHRNPFRHMLPLLGTFDYLREIVTATSAVHLATLRRCHGHHSGREMVDALVAKQRAFRLLRTALDGLDSSSRPFVLIAVVFFVNFDLIDSGRGGWKEHIQAAGRLINSLQIVDKSSSASAITALSDMVVADCITYHILGSTLTSPEDNGETAFDSIDILSVLRRAETFSYQCCPPAILQVLFLASRLPPGRTATTDETIASMIDQVQSVDIRAWVYGIQDLSPKDDLEARMRLASAHQAATCLYILLALSPTTKTHNYSSGLEDLVSEILRHLAFVPIDHALAKGTVWPTFMAGAQTQDQERRQWCLRRLQALWQSTPWVCPWGYVETAMDMLQGIWRDRKSQETGESERLNWLLRLRGLQDKCLIV